MLKREYTQMSESYMVGALLAVVGGYLDAYTYISRGKVFANAQTGNIVLMGLNFSQGNFSGTLHYLLPIIAFIVGVVISEAIKSRFRENSVIHWRQIVVAIEVFVLTAVAFVPNGSMNPIVNAAVSFVCALQFECFRKYTTTMCTGNLRSATEQLFIYKNTKNVQALTNSMQLYGIILFFILGVVLGTLLTNIFMEKAVLFSCIILAAVFGTMFIKDVR
ncbi:MAG: YoaK family protein [Sedimentibacter sp.]|uniref:YoaK family protein n=1 Tax=Sedimentibacter sp. TaxID=1960295 RepID=UPI0031595820